MKVAIHNLQMSYDHGPLVLTGVNLAVDSGSALAILGPSGVGKSTLLRAIAGLETPRAGTIVLDGRDVTRLAPSKRNLAFMGGPETAIDELTVEANIALPLRARGGNRSQYSTQVSDMARLLGIQEILKQRPSTISAGQRQRMSLARALIAKPKLLLADEPFAHLDARTRLELQSELKSLQTRERMTLIFVTHDAREAQRVGDRAAVLGDGIIQQTGTMADLMHRPASTWVSDLLGEGPSA